MFHFSFRSEILASCLPWTHGRHGLRFTSGHCLFKINGCGHLHWLFFGDWFQETHVHSVIIRLWCSFIWPLPLDEPWWTCKDHHVPGFGIWQQRIPWTVCLFLSCLQLSGRYLGGVQNVSTKFKADARPLFTVVLFPLCQVIVGFALDLHIVSKDSGVWVPPPPTVFDAGCRTWPRTFFEVTIYLFYPSFIWMIENHMCEEVLSNFLTLQLVLFFDQCILPTKSPFAFPPPTCC